MFLRRNEEHNWRMTLRRLTDPEVILLYILCTHTHTHTHTVEAVLCSSSESWSGHVHYGRCADKLWDQKLNYLLSPPLSVINWETHYQRDDVMFKQEFNSQVK